MAPPPSSPMLLWQAGVTHTSGGWLSAQNKLLAKKGPALIFRLTLLLAKSRLPGMSPELKSSKSPNPQELPTDWFRFRFRLGLGLLKMRLLVCPQDFCLGSFSMSDSILINKKRVLLSNLFVLQWALYRRNEFLFTLLECLRLPGTVGNILKIFENAENFSF